MALAHHNAPHRDQRRRREAKLLGAEQRGDGEVAARAKLPVDLHRRPASQVVGDQRLVRLGQAQLPGQAARLDRRPFRRSGPSVVAGDQHVVRVALDHSRGDDADAVFRDQFHRDARRRVGRLEVVDQLREVLDRVDVVVRRRGDESHAWGGPAGAGDVPGDLPPGKLAALAGLRPLRDLDLELVGVGQVMGGNAEAARGHLLDRRAHRVGRAVRRRHEPARVLAALARVGLAAQSVHRHGERRVGLEGDGAVGHGARDEPEGWLRKGGKKGR